MSLNKISRLIAEFCIKHSTLYLVETKDLVEKSQIKGFSHCRFYSNSRELINVEKLDRSSVVAKRYVFIGHVKKVKGIEVIKEAFKRLNENQISIDIYGPLFNGITKKWLEEVPSILYKGVVKPELVTSMLGQYDALVFPTFYPGEGYPGVILEAYSAGLPVITTQFLSIPEIVTNKTGILIAPNNFGQLVEALKKMSSDSELCQELRKGVLVARERYSDKYWADRFLEYCDEATQLL